MSGPADPVGAVDDLFAIGFEARQPIGSEAIDVRQVRDAAIAQGEPFAAQLMERTVPAGNMQLAESGSEFRVERGQSRVAPVQVEGGIGEGGSFGQ